MSTALHRALVEVGYKPTRLKPVTFEKAIEALLTPITKPRKQRKIRVSRAGSYYKARWEGNSDFVFGTCASGAIERLRSGKLGSLHK
jgi:hypothetical protein